jgi:hypothetical protein
MFPDDPPQNDAEIIEHISCRTTLNTDNARTDLEINNSSYTIITT